MAEWEVQEWDGTRSRNKVKLWPCTCSGCGTTKHLSRSSIDTNQKGCRSCSLRTKTTHSLARQCWKSFKVNSKGRGLLVEIDFNEWYSLSQLPCRYCGLSGQNLREFIDEDRHFQFRYNGIDRINPDEGYIAGNIVPCCWPCNRAKSTFSHDDFVDHISKIYRHLNGI